MVLDSGLLFWATLYMCNRKRQQFKDYPCDTFTFAKQFAFELPHATLNTATACSLNLFATRHANDSVRSWSTDATAYQNRTLETPAFRVFPDVIAQNSTRQGRQRVDIDEGYTNTFGAEKPGSWKNPVENQSAEMNPQDRCRNGSVVIDIRNYSSASRLDDHQTKTVSGSTSTRRASADRESTIPERNPPPPGCEGFVELTDEFCVNVVDDAFGNIVHIP